MRRRAGRGRAGPGRPRDGRSPGPTSTAGWPRPARWPSGRELVDLHGQHAHQSLLHAAAQRAALDRFGGVDLGPLRAARARGRRRSTTSSAALGGDEPGPGPRDRPAAVPGGRARRRRHRRARRGRALERRGGPAGRRHRPPRGGGRAAGAQRRCAARRPRGGRRRGPALAAVAGRAPFARRRGPAAGGGRRAEPTWPPSCGARARRSTRTPSASPPVRERAPAAARPAPQVRRHAGRRLAEGDAAPGPARPSWRTTTERAAELDAASAGRRAAEAEAAAAVAAARRAAAPRLAERRRRPTWPSWPCPGARSRWRSAATTPATTSSSCWPPTPARRRCRWPRSPRAASWPGPCWRCACVLDRARPPTLVFDEVDAGIGGRPRSPSAGRWPPWPPTTRCWWSPTCPRWRPSPTPRSRVEQGRATTADHRGAGAPARRRRAGGRAVAHAVGPARQRRRPRARRRAAGDRGRERGADVARTRDDTSTATPGTERRRRRPPCAAVRRAQPRWRRVGPPAAADRCRPGHGVARVDRRTKDLVKRLQPGEVAVIDHEDLDRVAAETLVEAGPVAVVNAAPSITGPLPEPRPAAAAAGRHPALDDVGPEVMDAVAEGQPVTVDGDQVLVGGRRSWRGAPARRSQTLERRHRRGPEQHGRGARAVRREHRSSTSARRATCSSTSPTCPTSASTSRAATCSSSCGASTTGRTCRLLRQRATSRSMRPVLIGVDGGADALLRDRRGARHHHRRLRLGVGADAALRRPAVVHGYTGGRAPGAERLDDLGLPYTVFAAAGHQRGHRHAARLRGGGRADRGRRHPQHHGRVPRQGPGGHGLDVPRAHEGRPDPRRRQGREPAVPALGAQPRPRCGCLLAAVFTLVVVSCRPSRCACGPRLLGARSSPVDDQLPLPHRLASPPCSWRSASAWCSGTTFLDDALEDQLEGDRSTELESDLDRAGDRNGDSSTSSTSSRRRQGVSTSSSASASLAGQLLGRPGAGRAPRGVDEGLGRSGSMPALAQADAEVVGTWWLTDRLVLDDDDEVADLADALDLSTDDTSRLRTASPGSWPTCSTAQSTCRRLQPGRRAARWARPGPTGRTGGARAAGPAPRGRVRRLRAARRSTATSCACRPPACGSWW